MRVKTKRKIRPVGLFFNTVVVLLNLIAVAMLVVSAYSDMVSPVKGGVAFAYLGLAFPLLVVINVIFLVVSIVRRRWSLLFVMLLAFVACIKPFNLYCPFHPRTEAPTGDDVIKLLTYNVMGFDYRNHTPERPNEIIRYIADSKADIVCLQEYLTDKSGKRMSSEAVAAALPMYPYKSETTFNNPEKIGYTYGIMTLSKFPITQTRRLPLVSKYNGATLYNINVRGRTLVLVNCHLESFKLTTEDKTKLLSTTFLSNFEEYGSQLEQKLGEAYRIRAKQAELISREIRAAGGYYTVVCGDFNDTPISYAHKELRDVLKDAFAASGNGPGISYNRNHFLFRIDHILHSASMQSYNCRVDRSINLSDHYPMYCWLKLK